MRTVNIKLHGIFFFFFALQCTGNEIVCIPDSLKEKTGGLAATGIPRHGNDNIADTFSKMR